MLNVTIVALSGQIFVSLEWNVTILLQEHFQLHQRDSRKTELKLMKIL